MDTQQVIAFIAVGFLGDFSNVVNFSGPQFPICKMI